MNTDFISFKNSWKYMIGSVIGYYKIYNGFGWISDSGELHYYWKSSEAKQYVDKLISY